MPEHDNPPPVLQEETGTRELREAIAERIAYVVRMCDDTAYADGRGEASHWDAAAGHVVLLLRERGLLAPAPPSGETGGSWRSDPEAISGLVAHSLDVNHGRSSFAIAQAVVDDLTQHGVLSPTACTKCGSRDAAPCADAACPRYAAAPAAGETGDDRDA
jgi:hypothetical protein